jgi:hypothetical protein
MNVYKTKIIYILICIKQKINILRSIIFIQLHLMAQQIVPLSLSIT